MKLRSIGYWGGNTIILPSKGIFKCCNCGKIGFYLFYPEICKKCSNVLYPIKLKHRNNQLGRDRGVIMDILKLLFCGISFWIVIFFILIAIIDRCIL